MTMFIQLSEFNFAHGQPTCKALYMPFVTSPVASSTPVLDRKARNYDATEVTKITIHFLLDTIRMETRLPS